MPEALDPNAQPLLTIIDLEDLQKRRNGDQREVQMAAVVAALQGECKDADAAAGGGKKDPGLLGRG